MTKLKMHTPDLVAENVEKIAELFPGCVTEAKDEQTGQLTRKIDFDQLRQELSDHIVEGPCERYHLDWPGKREALLAANAPIAKTLRPCREESVDFDTTKNLFIEGDNLEALKLLQEAYLGKVKLIYVDPPYNTGNDFVYKDDFSEDAASYMTRSNQHDEAGMRLVANTASNGRFHSQWLSMLYPRLRLARNLLSDDGAILISIDDNEAHNLRKMCDEIFGVENFLCEFVWKCRQFTDARSVTNVSTDHEYIVCYSKGSDVALRGNPRDESKYANPDSDSRGPWMSRSILGLATKDQRPNLHYTIVDPETGWGFDPPETTGWRYGRDRMNELLAQGCILFPKDRSGRPREKKFRADLKSEFTSFPTVIDGVHTSDGTASVRELFGAQVFDFPKPPELLQKLIQQLTSAQDIVLDIFAGSSSTAHAVFLSNVDDLHRRRFIMVQLEEPCPSESVAAKEGFQTIAELSRERIRRAGEKIKSDNATTAPAMDVGFRALRIDSSIAGLVHYRPAELLQGQLGLHSENIKEDRSAEDLLFHVMLDWGVDLATPVETRVVLGMNLHLVDGNALIACFDRNVGEEVVKELARLRPLRAVFRDSSYESDSAKVNVEQLFKLLSPETEVRNV